MTTTTRIYIRTIKETVNSSNLLGVVTETFIRISHSRIKLVGHNSTNQYLQPSYYRTHTREKEDKPYHIEVDASHQRIACKTQCDRISY
jgi:hypothetical protein